MQSLTQSTNIVVNINILGRQIKGENFFFSGDKMGLVIVILKQHELRSITLVKLKNNFTQRTNSQETELCICHKGNLFFISRVYTLPYV